MTIGALSIKAAAAAMDRRGFASGQVISHWSAIVGEELAGFAAPLEVKFPRQRNDHATLVLQVASGAAATMLHLKTPMMLERINAFLGYNAVSRIEAHQGPLPKRKQRRVATRAPAALPSGDTERIQQATKSVASDSVRGALERLGVSVARRMLDDTTTGHDAKMAKPLGTTKRGP